jgi:hypothetical protein
VPSIQAPKRTKEVIMANSFQQSIDDTRPHTCLTLDARSSGTLTYRYEDTQEVVTVPNIWYNQPFQARASWVRGQAQLKDEAAARFHRSPQLGMSAEEVAQVVARWRLEAVHIRSEAVRMEAAGVATHPVAASRLQLNFSAA